MADLLDEMESAVSTKIGANVRAVGGDLLDEAGFKSSDSSMISEKLSKQQLDENLNSLLDEINADLSTFDRFAVGAGRGMTTIARGLGLAEPEPEVTTRAFNRLADDSTAATIGEIVGEAAPFLAAAPLAGAGLATSSAGRALIPAATKTATRVAGAAALGSLEGGAIVRGRGGSTGETATGAVTGGIVAGTIEALFPVLGRLGRKVFQRLGRTPKGPLLTPEGRPTPELQRALDETGTSFDDLTREAFATVNREGVDPAQAARAARLSQQGIPATAGDISQDFAQQAAEQRLISQAGAEAGEPLRQLKLQQSEAFKSRVGELIDSLGVPSDAGDSIKSALQGRKKLLRTQKNELYREVADAAPELGKMPLIVDNILEAVPTSDTLEDLAITAPESVKAIRLALARFGIDQSDEALELAASSGVTPQPLTMASFERFRKVLNNIERADQSGAASVAVGPIKRALDAEAEIVDSAIKQIGGVDRSILDVLGEARQRVRTLKTEFSPQSITGRLIDVKRDGVTPVVEASKAARELLKPGAPIENLQRTLSSLSKSGDKGAKAIKDMQASVVLNALEDALKAPSRKTSGIETIGGNQFAKSLSKFGDDKLDILFEGNPKALSRLKNLKQTALDISPSSAATPKGSSPVILDIMKRAGSLPGLAAIRDSIEFVVKAGADERAVRKAINAKPAFKRTVSALETDFPAIASALGVAAVAPQIKERER